METTIGRRLAGSRPRLSASAAVALLVVAADYVLVARGNYSYLGARGWLPLLALGSLSLLSLGDPGTVGLGPWPQPGVRYWIDTAAWLGLALGSVSMSALLGLNRLGGELPIRSTHPDRFGAEFVRMCLLAPTVEEGVYRLGLCGGLVAWIGPGRTIVASGVLFGGLHVLYGNPGPDNLLAGFYLAWSYLKSGTILVPIALHALGNFCVLASWIALWYST